jgi:hypothetical protein
LSNFAVKEECCITVLNSGGVDALMAAFDAASATARSPHSAPRQTPVEELAVLADLRAVVASAIWTTSADCADVQAVLFSSGWLTSLASVLQANPTHSGLHEAAIGIARGLSRNAAYREDVINLGFVQASIEAMRNFSDNAVLLKEACGVFGNLATDPEIRVQLGECGVLEAVFSALSRCRSHEDRKVAKLALGACANLASCEANRILFARLQPAPELLEAARVFIQNENILEYAIQAISHLAVHEGCNLQLVEAGAVEALLLFLGEHGEDRDVVSKSLVALRRLLKHSAGADSADPPLLRKITRAGRQEGTRGVALLVDAFKAHYYDETIAKETALLLTSLSRSPGLIPVLLSLAAQPCMKAMEVHQNEAAVADALAGLLARLPLEEDEQWAKGGDMNITT